MKRALLIAAAFTSTAGCTADIGVYDADGTKVKGYPVRVPVVYVIESELTRHKTEGENCIRTPLPVAFQALPTGEQYFVDPETGPFADSEFALEFNDNGSVKAVRLNSESNVATALDSAGKFLTTTGLLATLGVAPAAPIGAAALNKAEAPQSSAVARVACDSGPVVKRIVTVEEFRNSSNRT